MGWGRERCDGIIYDELKWAFFWSIFSDEKDNVPVCWAGNNPRGRYCGVLMDIILRVTSIIVSSAVIFGGGGDEGDHKKPPITGLQTWDPCQIYLNNSLLHPHRLKLLPIHIDNTETSSKIKNKKSKTQPHIALLIPPDTLPRQCLNQSQKVASVMMAPRLCNKRNSTFLRYTPQH